MFRYGGLLLVLALLYLAARRWIGPTRWAAAALVSAALLAVGALATPIDNLKPAITDPALAAENLGKNDDPRPLRRAWHGSAMRRRPSAVIAVNNQWIDPANLVPLEFIYSAFSERRVFLEGWGYSQRSRDLGLRRSIAG